MSEEDRYYTIAFIIIEEWLKTTDPTNDPKNIHLTNRDILAGLIVDELKKEKELTQLRCMPQ